MGVLTGSDFCFKSAAALGCGLGAGRSSIRGLGLSSGQSARWWQRGQKREKAPATAIPREQPGPDASSFVPHHSQGPELRCKTGHSAGQTLQPGPSPATLLSGTRDTPEGSPLNRRWQACPQRSFRRADSLAHGRRGASLPHQGPPLIQRDTDSWRASGVPFCLDTLRWAAWRGKSTPFSSPLLCPPPLCVCFTTNIPGNAIRIN